MPLELEKARKSLHDIENSWYVIIDEINQDKSRQMPRAEGNRTREKFKDQFDQFTRLYTPELDADRDFYLELINTVRKIDSRLDMALLEGKRRYENEIHRRKIEKIYAYGTFLNNIKFNIVALILGILSTVMYYSIKP